MRISDWSSDVCSSDLLDVDEPYTLVDAPQMAQIVVFVELVAHRVPGAMRRKRARAVGALELRRPVAAADLVVTDPNAACRSEEHTSELQSLMRISYAVFRLRKKKNTTKHQPHQLN